MIWLIATIIVAATVTWIVLPIFRSSGQADVRAEQELAVYQDQLSEIKHDHAMGLVNDDQADADEIEISRRMLAVNDTLKQGKTSSLTGNGRSGALAFIILVSVAGTFTIYSDLGSPEQKNHPLVKTSEATGEHAANDMSGAIGRLAARLQKNPNDFEGWVLLARSYEFTQDFANTAKAYGRAFEIRGEDANIAGAYAEALTKAQGGIVPPTANLLFQQLAQENPEDPRNHYYIGIAESQAGRGQRAIDIWLALLAKSPADAPWVPAITQQINQTAAQFSINVEALKTASSTGAAPSSPGPSAEQVSAAAKMSENEQDRMIRSMVDRLAERLEDNPADINGWLRLARAQVVLNEQGSARQSLKKALEQASTDALRQQVQSLANELGIGLQKS